MNCLLCDATINTDTWQMLILHRYPTRCCVKCRGKFEAFEEPVDISDFKGTKYEGSLDSISCLFHYNDWMKDVLHVYKFLGDVELAEIFREDLQILRQKKITVIPIPMHSDKLTIRTFSPVHELLKKASISYEDALEKISSITIGKLKKEERLAASVLFHVTKVVKGKDILLFDDLYTTGVTLHHAALVLKKAGATSVRGITLIHA